jgi:Zn-dependent M28 family amino/carboxypeptidase
VTKRSVALYLSIIGLLLAGIIAWYTYSFISQPALEAVAFDGQRAYADVQTQVAFGPRVPGSEGHAKIQEWMQEELEAAGWQVEIQTSEALGHPIENLVARRSATPPLIILGAHYDTRIFADNDPDPAQHTNFVPGANDGASGVAVLLELARSLPEETVPVWLVFFDAEDNGRIEGWDWILGSREFVKNNPVQPRAAIIVDMIGDADLNIERDTNSTPWLEDLVLQAATSLGYQSHFFGRTISVQDDHLSFVPRGVPCADLIDLDYGYGNVFHHTPQDTIDKLSPKSMEIVGSVILETVRLLDEKK